MVCIYRESSLATEPRSTNEGIEVWLKSQPRGGVRRKVERTYDLMSDDIEKA